MRSCHRSFLSLKNGNYSTSMRNRVFDCEWEDEKKDCDDTSCSRPNEAELFRFGEEKCSPIGTGKGSTGTGKGVMVAIIDGKRSRLIFILLF